MTGSRNAAPSPANTTPALSALKELPLPEPVSWMPHTAGWLAIFIVLVLVALWMAWAGFRRHDRQRYRRVALAELRDIEASLHDKSQRDDALAAIPALIKRTSLAAFPAGHTASLSGEEWLTFLSRTRGHFDERSGALLTTLSYAPAGCMAALQEHEIDTLLSVTRDWIERHHVET